MYYDYPWNIQHRWIFHHYLMCIYIYIQVIPDVSNTSTMTFLLCNGIYFMNAGVGWPAERELSRQCGWVWMCFVLFWMDWREHRRIPCYTKILTKHFRVFGFTFRWNQTTDIHWYMKKHHIIQERSHFCCPCIWWFVLPIQL